jgi:hypothetical protein
MYMKFTKLNLDESLSCDNCNKSIKVAYEIMGVSKTENEYTIMLCRICMTKLGKEAKEANKQLKPVKLGHREHAELVIFKGVSTLRRVNES